MLSLLEQRGQVDLESKCISARQRFRLDVWRCDANVVLWRITLVNNEKCRWKGTRNRVGL